MRRAGVKAIRDLQHLWHCTLLGVSPPFNFNVAPPSHHHRLQAWYDGKIASALAIPGRSQAFERGHAAGTDNNNIFYLGRRC
jgi:hypothetical protein